MSAKDRLEQASKARDEQQNRMGIDGAKELMASPNGRALMAIWLLPNLEAEGEQGAGRRAMARDLYTALKVAAFDGVQIMREEWERPLIFSQQDLKAAAEGADDDDQP